MGRMGRINLMMGRIAGARKLSWRLVYGLQLQQGLSRKRSVGLAIDRRVISHAGQLPNPTLASQSLSRRWLASMPGPSAHLLARPDKTLKCRAIGHLW